MEQKDIYMAVIGRWDEEARQKAISTLKEKINSKFGVDSLVYDLYEEARNDGSKLSDLREAVSASVLTDGITEIDIMNACEALHNLQRRELETVSLLSIMNIEPVTRLQLAFEPMKKFLPEPEEEPGLSEAQIKKQLKYEKNPMRIKQLNIMLNKKRKEQVRRK